MTVLHDTIPTRNAAPRSGACPPPVSLETLGLVEHALAETLRSLRRMAPPTAQEDAAAAEYESWRAHYR